MNLHATQLEKILLDRGLTITKLGRDWRVSNGNGKHVDYTPTTGVCHVPSSALLRAHREELRGGPDRVAEILEGLIA